MVLQARSFPFFSHPQPGPIARHSGRSDQSAPEALSGARVAGPGSRARDLDQNTPNPEGCWQNGRQAVSDPGCGPDDVRLEPQWPKEPGTSPVHVTIITLFPALIQPFLEATVLGRAVGAGLVRVDLLPLREFGRGRHKVIDDRPFGGGPGMVLQAGPVMAAGETAGERHGAAVRTLLLSPDGRRFEQPLAESLATATDGFILLCGRYEGIDERAIEVLQPEIVSIGDYVLSGGEAAALVVLDAAARLVPGVLGDLRSPQEDSFSGPKRILDHPHYTRPLEVRGLEVPEVLRSGDHAAIAAWRSDQALHRTRERRPDLLED